MSEMPPPIDLLPHRPPMILLSEVVGYRGAEFGARVRIGADSLMADEQGRVPAWVGIEYMAQTIAAQAGYRQRLMGEAVRPGFLLACRQCTMQVPHFLPGQSLLIWCTTEVDNVDLGNYSCRLLDELTGNELMNASLTVFQPQDLDAFMAKNYRRHE